MSLKSIHLRGVCAVALVAAGLAGCASSEVATQTAAGKERAEALAQIAAKPMAAADISPIKVKDSVYVSANVTRNERGDPLPPRWERGAFSMGKARLANFQEIAVSITEQTGIPVAVTSVYAGSTQTQQQSFRPAGGDPSLNQALGSIQAGGVPGTIQTQVFRASETQTGVDSGIQGRMQVRYDGSLPGFLDNVATNFNVAWEYKENRIVFHRYITRTFDVPALPVSSDLSFALKSGQSGTTGGVGGTGGSTGGPEQTASTKSSFDVWKDLDVTLQSMIAREGGSVQTSSQRGAVTVTATPAAVRRVQDYLKSVNESLAKQVALNVKVYSVVLSDADNFSSDVNLLLQPRNPAGAANAVIGIARGPNSTALTTGTGVTVTNSGSREGIGWAILNNGLLGGSNGIVNLLSQKGDVSVVTSASATAINGQPVPIQVANTRGYAARVSVTQTAASGGLTGTTALPQTSIEPGSVTTGFNLHLVPRIQRDGSVMLQYGLNVSELVGAQNGFDVFTTNGSSIQLPNINQRNFIQQAILPNNSTLVLAGFEQVRSTGSRSGQGASFLWPLGGTSTSSMQREILVVAITPTVLDMNNPASSIPMASTTLN